MLRAIPIGWSGIIGKCWKCCSIFFRYSHRCLMGQFGVMESMPSSYMWKRFYCIKIYSFIPRRHPLTKVICPPSFLPQEISPASITTHIFPLLNWYASDWYSSYQIVNSDNFFYLQLVTHQTHTILIYYNFYKNQRNN